MAYASSADVAALAARALSTEEHALVNRRLEQVERMILRRIPDLDTKITGGDILEDDVIDIEAEAVYRAIRNPDGYVSEGDGTYQYQLNREAADNRLRVTAEEWAVLGVRVGKMFQISPSIGGLA